MQCPECLAADERSTLDIHSGMTTSMGWSPYYDEDGKYHSHDPNYTTYAFSCSRGHRFVHSMLSPCPNCDYGMEEAG